MDPEDISDQQEPHSGDFEAIWCADNTALGIVAGIPVYSDGESFRDVEWREALIILARLIDEDPNGQGDPRELTLFLRSLIVLDWELCALRRPMIFLPPTAAGSPLETPHISDTHYSTFSHAGNRGTARRLAI